MRNTQRAVSGGEQIMGPSQSEDGDSRGQQILTVVGERGSSGRGCLPALLLQPAQILRPWPGNTWLAHTNSKDRSAFVWGYHTESYQLCLLSSGHSWISPSWFSVIALAPLCAHELGVSISCFYVLRLQQISLHFSVIVPLGYKFSPFPVLSLFLNWHLSVLRTSYVQGSPEQSVILS